MFTPKELILRPKPAPITDFNLTQAPTRIIACPDPPIEAVRAGHAIAIPDDTFDIRSLLKQLQFQPDLVSLSARVMTFLPRGLHKLHCPTVMKLGDTFHLGDGGLSGMVNYCKQLNCDYHWTYQSPQHLHFFAEAGLKNVFWLPGSIVIDPYSPHSSEKQDTIIFRGSESELHQYRTHILNVVQASGINIDVCQKDYISSLEDYAKARIVINSSLNGDLNRRVFEVLMAGGFLLTDRIRPQSGLFELFEEGKHFECYGNETELIEKIQFYLAHPQQANQIAKAGHEHFLNHYSQQTVQQQLYRSIFNKLEFRKHDRRSHTSKQLQTRLKLYELVQELHRIYPRLKILCWRTCSTIVADLADLPRADLTHVVDPKQLAQIQTDYLQAGLQVNVQADLQSDPGGEFQIIVISGVDRALKQQIQQSTNLLCDRGFFIIVQPFNLFAIPQLNQWMRNQRCIPIQLSIRLFDQNYDLALEQHGLLYQKLSTQAHSATLQDKADLVITEIRASKIIKTQIKTAPIICRILSLIRKLRSRFR
jgi:hypothetical protein